MLMMIEDLVLGKSADESAGLVMCEQFPVVGQRKNTNNCS